MAEGGDAEEAEKLAQWHALRERIDRHPGMLAKQDWELLSVVCQLADRNLFELCQLLDAASTPELGVELFQNVREPTVRRAFSAELVRRLHNYVASVSTLIDHTRNHMKAYEGTLFAEEYESRKNALVANPVSAFVKDLRNFFLHRGVPPIATTVRILDEGDQELETEIALDVQGLLLWDRWSAKARQFLEGKEQVVLRAAFEEYASLVGALNQWVLGQFDSLHGSQMLELRTLSQEWESFWS